MTTESDSTGSTPNIFRSPVRETEQIVAVEGQSITTDVVGDQVIRASPKSVKYKGNTYQGFLHIEETEVQDKSSDSEDEIPLATLVRHEKGKSLTLQQIQDCKEGPLEERAVGVTIAKTFDGVEFRGTIY